MEKSHFRNGVVQENQAKFRCSSRRLTNNQGTLTGLLAQHKGAETSQTFHAPKSNPLTGAGDNPPTLWSTAVAFAKSLLTSN
jgi:hypothetical protein